MTKTVCPKHHVAYDASAGCLDCLARERDVARGVPDDDAPLYTTAANPWLDASRDILADLAELAERFMVRRPWHNVTPNGMVCVDCGMRSIDVEGTRPDCVYPKQLGLDANGSPVDDEPTIDPAQLFQIDLSNMKMSAPELVDGRHQVRVSVPWKQRG